MHDQSPASPRQPAGPAAVGVPVPSGNDPQLPPTGPHDSVNRGVIGALLAGWVAVTFGVGYFARELQFLVLGWPFSFWMAAQGGVIAYVGITCLYARRMARLERSS
ncbi:MAG: DUF4212 domain-containing protein [Ramlibacter sp.]